MRSLLLILLLAALLAAPQAILYNNTYGGVDTNKWTGQQINASTQVVPWPTPGDVAIVGSDVEIGGYDYFNATREHFVPGAPRIVIDLPQVCEGADIAYQVFYDGQPLAGATVGLYTHQAGGTFSVDEPETLPDGDEGAGGGRAFIAEETSGPDGRGAFFSQPDGGYDLYATYPNYSSGLAVFRIGPCMPPADSYRQTAPAPRTAPAGPAGASYGPSLSRTLAAITLPNGQEATEVTVQAQAPEDGGNFSLVEVIPASLASSMRAVGFQSDYPDSISAQAPFQLSWTLDGLRAGENVSRSYVLLRPMQAGLLDAYGPPALFDADGNEVLGGNATAAANAQGQAGAQGGSGKTAGSSVFDTADSLTGLAGGWGLPAGIGLLALAGAGLVLWKKLESVPEKSSEPLNP